VDDANEDNDDAASATVVTGSQTISGKLCPSDQDLYVVALAPDEALVGTLTATAPGIVLTLEDAQGVTVLEGLAAAGVQTLKYRAPVQADLTLRVAGPPGDSPYLLDVELIAGPLPIDGCSDRFEPNDLPLGASAVTAGEELGLSLCGSDRSDYFAIDVAAGVTLTVEASFAHLAGNIDLDVLDASTGERIAEARSGDDGEAISLPAAAEDFRALIHVFAAETAPSGTVYDLTLTLQ
jgi:hypothetical protein